MKQKLNSYNNAASGMFTEQSLTPPVDTAAHTINTTKKQQPIKDAYYILEISGFLSGISSELDDRRKEVAREFSRKMKEIADKELKQEASHSHLIEEVEKHMIDIENRKRVGVYEYTPDQLWYDKGQTDEASRVIKLLQARKENDELLQRRKR